jgi:uncharacterized Tic20 family protein
MIDHIDTFAAFLVLGIGGFVGPAVAIWLLLRRRVTWPSDGQ